MNSSTEPGQPCDSSSGGAGPCPSTCRKWTSIRRSASELRPGVELAPPSGASRSRAPECDQFAHERERRAVTPRRIGRFVGPAHAGKSRAQLFDCCVLDGKAERRDHGRHQHRLSRAGLPKWYIWPARGPIATSARLMPAADRGKIDGKVAHPIGFTRKWRLR